MGYVYYGNYPSYLEVARVEALRSLGLSYADMEDIHQVALPVAHLEIKYIRPAYYDTQIKMVTEIRELPGKSISFHTDMFNEADEIINRSTVRLAFIRASGERCTAPDYMINALKSYF